MTKDEIISHMVFDIMDILSSGEEYDYPEIHMSLDKKYKLGFKKRQYVVEAISRLEYSNIIEWTYDSYIKIKGFPALWKFFIRYKKRLAWDC
jgi:hypothetical protein